MQNTRNRSKHLILLSLLLASTSSFAAGSSKTSTSDIESGLKRAGFKKFDLNFDSSFKSLDSDTDEYSKFETNINAVLKSNLATGFDFNFDGGFKYQSGSSYNEEENRAAEFKPKFSYNYGYFNYRPVNFANLSFGALDNSSKQKYISPFINGGNSFIGAREVFAQKYGNFYLRFQATQARPQNRTLAETLNVENNGTPQFFSESIDATYLTKGFKIYTAAGLYRYLELSADVADNDYYWGNSVMKGVTTDQSLYLYDFTGFFVNSGIEAKLGTNKLKAFFSYINNQDAPEEKNTGYLVGASLETRMLTNKVIFEASAFTNQSDTAPAFYRSTPYANDYEGFTTGLTVKSSFGFETQIEYTNRSVIGNTDSVYLYDGYSDEQIIGITLRKMYDIL